MGWYGISTRSEEPLLIIKARKIKGNVAQSLKSLIKINSESFTIGKNDIINRIALKEDNIDLLPFRCTVAPNPFSEMTYIYWDRPITKGHIQIYDTFGNLMIDKAIENKTFYKVNADDLAGAGVYFYLITEGTNRNIGKLVLD